MSCILGHLGHGSAITSLRRAALTAHQLALADECGQLTLSQLNVPQDLLAGNSQGDLPENKQGVLTVNMK